MYKLPCLFAGNHTVRILVRANVRTSEPLGRMLGADDLALEFRTLQH
jgi:hypothetical protein